jgi:hypothetical protein
MDREARRERQQKFNEDLKDLLLYVGFAGALISAVAYIIMTIVMINGFSSAIDVEKQITFSILSSMIGLVISFLLRSQGIAFAKNEDEAQEVMKEYRELRNKEKDTKDLRTIGYHMTIATIKDIIIKGTMIAGSMFGIFYMFAEGNGDWSLLGLALSNILMFTGFGLVALSKMYDKYIDEHLNVVRERISRIKEEKENTDVQVDRNECKATPSIRIENED